ncbi:helix-turn-helix transcriptional regulator [Algibacter mikhailovii]|uniref:helix-turn-helix transcriptional regulator n=1 Tax=Algibacter mikhailovii TaxID=425498 RepID=UPI002493DBC4|nr:helix-turn-helix transcriptional regulator [Algibacter mikhailovii]
MMFFSKQFTILTLTLCIAVSTHALISVSDNNPPQDYDLYAQLLQNDQTQNTDSSAEELKILFQAALQDKDTIRAINTLMKLARNYSHQANHKITYDVLWTALSLADEGDFDFEKSEIYRAIGRHYNYFNRREKSLEYLNRSLNIKKQLVAEDKLKESSLTSNYLAFTSSFRELNELKLGKIYLDSCFMYLDSTVKPSRQAFIEFEHAVILNDEEKHQKALETFNSVLPWFTENIPSYNVLVYTYMGDVAKDLKDFSESERLYAQALETSYRFNAHNDFTPLIHERLAELYFSQGHFEKAYSSMKSAKKLDGIYFDSRSVNNRPLLEIQDAFLKEKELQAKAEQNQKIIQFKQEEKVLLLQKVILIGLVISIVIFGLLYLNIIRAKHRAEKRILSKKRAFEMQKNQEVIELKNKELAASVIKLIEKDSFIDALKKKLSDGTGDIDRREAKQIINSISNSNNDNWTEFEARFISINKKFYTKLSTKFPNLTVNDQRLCALVKLNFSSKEIAKLLNMSVESVHTTRSRLRKKLELSRNTNLKQFIADI